jgi:hypothetical protein
MADDEPSLELKLARQAYAEAERIKKSAEQDRAAAEYDRGQIEHRRREIAQIEASITRREQALKQAGEPAFLARVAAADKALADAQQLMKAYNADRHGAMVALQSIDAREKAERAAA